MDAAAYAGREQSAAKHLVLERYLEMLAFKVGFFRSGLTLNYIDGFAGPWESKTSDLSDTSPAIALKKLVEVRNQVSGKGRSMTVRGFFVSLKGKGVAQLESLRARFPEVEIQIVEGTFLDSLDSARRFAKQGADPFAFLFIDPTGWTGLDMQQLGPLLRDGKNEVLINFMTGHIGRFIDSQDSRYEGSFIELFGDASYRQQWRGLRGLDREDAMVEAYCQRVRQAGQYKHVVSSVILNPRIDRTHYHLVYGTRSDEGLSAFREVERKGMRFQRDERVALRPQGDFFQREASFRTYEDELRDRYHAKAWTQLEALIVDKGATSWEEVVFTALQTPMICEADVKEWLQGRMKQGVLEVLGLAPRERVPKRGEGHIIRRVRRLL